MTRRFSIPALTCALAAGFIAIASGAAQAQTAPLSLSSATVSIDGTSNIHDFTASTKDVRVTRLVIATGAPGATVLANPAAVEAFAIVVKAASLTSPKEGLDKNMHKALKVTEFPEIAFRLTRIEGSGAALKAFGALKIAGVEKEVAFDLKTAATATTLTVSGEVPLLMTDYGIAAPKAMMGMLKTSPKITVKFETVFAVPTTF
jgi:polyisoprenoid-binding protein YceI